MCGISGVFNRNGVVDARSRIDRMNGAMSHRGPDADGFYASSSCALGHTRLSIIDLNDRSNQPMFSACGRYVMVYNGEVYNYGEIASKILADHGENSGFHLKTSGDSEVVLEAFALYGAAFVELLNGMFAIAIYDTQEEELHLFRDRLGIKPLFYFYKDGTLAFASELKALKALGLPDTELNGNSVAEFLQLGFIPAPNTIYKNVKKLPGGCMLKIGSGAPEVSRYWNLDDRIIRKTHDDMQQVIVQLSDLLVSSVQYQLRSDVPFGVFLSGGVDSSLVTAQAVMMSSSRISTFSIGFEESRYNESEYARAVASYLNTDHHEFIVTYNDALALVEGITDVYDEPFADSSCIPTMLVSKLARSKVTVTLSGEGGDELFFGYGSHQWARRLGMPLADLARHPMSMVFQHMGARYKRVGELLDYGSGDNLMKHIFGQEQYLFSHKSAMRFVNPEICFDQDEGAKGSSLSPVLSYKHFEEQFESGRIGRRLTRMEMQALFDLKVYLQDDLLTKVDRASMRFSLESRVPYLDHRLVEYAVNISPDLKYNNGIPKYVLKEILYQYLPEKLFDRPKQGFSIPLQKWLRNELHYLIDEYLSEAKVKEFGLFNWKEVKSLKDRFDAGDTLYYNRIWALLVVQMWRSKNS